MMRVCDPGASEMQIAGDRCCRRFGCEDSMPAKQQKPNYSELVVRVVRESAEPLPFDEIMRRVSAIRAIHTKNPRSTIRSAISQCRLIANDGQGLYGWYPRLMNGSRVRVMLSKADLNHKPPRVLIDDDARELIWPGFFASQKYADHEPVEADLPDGQSTRLPLEHYGEGTWGTPGSPEFWKWLRARRSAPGDALIFEAMDGEARRYRVTLDTRASRDIAMVKQRTDEAYEIGLKRLRDRRAWGMSQWDAARYLLATGYYKHPTPPEPISAIWQRIVNEHHRRNLPPCDIYTLKVTLLDSSPKIWRRVQVRGDWTLGALHYVMQVAMGWTNSHLHHFIFARGGKGDQQEREYYSLYLDFDETGLERDSTRVKLQDMAPKVKSRFHYEYDFGDSWMHEILVEAIVPPKPGATYPVCLDGARACPPDDCGGVWGYADLLKAVRNPRHPEHEELTDWLASMKGEDFDPESFDPLRTNFRLRWFKPEVLDSERNVFLFME